MGVPDSNAAIVNGGYDNHLGAQVSALVKEFEQYRTQLSPQVYKQAVTSMIAGVDKYPH